LSSSFDLTHPVGLHGGAHRPVSVLLVVPRESSSVHSVYRQSISSTDRLPSHCSRE